MIGKISWAKSVAAAPSLAKRPAVVATVGILVAGVAATGVWLSQRPATAPQQQAAGSDAVRAVTASRPGSEAAPAPAIPAAVALPEVAAPPEPTAAELVRGAAPPAAAAEPAKPIDWAAMPIDELRPKAAANDIPAMEELARRLIQGIGVTKDQQAGAGWLLRAAQNGSAASAFNVAVMYERGFVVERDSARAIEWYRKAVAADMPAAKHNLALLLRDGKGAPRDGKEAIELLRSAARQGMAASMFTLGDIHERGDATPKDDATALAWFAIAAEFERQTNRGGESALAKTAAQRSQTLQCILTPAELERAQRIGQSEFKIIVETLSPPKPATDAAAPETVAAPPPPDIDPPGWPKLANEQIRVIQQGLFDLKFLREKPDGTMGPMTRTAIRSFQRSIAMRETGEPTRDVYVALRQFLTKGDIVANSPLPLPPPAKVEMPPVVLPQLALPGPEYSKPEAPKVAPPKEDRLKSETKPVEEARSAPATAEPATPVAPKAEGAKPEPPTAEVKKADPPKPPPAKVESEKTAPGPVAVAVEPSPTVPKTAAASATIDIGQPELPPPPPTSAEIAQTMPHAAAPDSGKAASPEPVFVPAPWPSTAAEQVKAIQQLLRDLNFSSDAPDGINGPVTRTAIRDYERAAGLDVTGEPNKALFESLTELRHLMVRKAN